MPASLSPTTDIAATPPARPVRQMSRQQSIKNTLHTTGLNHVVPADTAAHAAVSDGCLVVIFVVVLVAMSPFVLIPLRICLKADGTTNESWAQTFNLLWIVDGFVAVWALTTCCAYHKDSTTATTTDKAVATTTEGPDKATLEDAQDIDEAAVIASIADTDDTDDQAPPPACMQFATKLMVLLTLVSHILISLRLDGVLDWPWTYVLLPWMLGSTYGSVTNTPLMLQLLLVALKLDAAIAWSWALVFVPMYAVAAVTLVVASTSMTIAGGVWLGVATTLVVLLLFAPFGILVARLVGRTAFSTIYVVVPWFVLVGVGILVAFSYVVFLTSLAADANDNDAVGARSEQTTSDEPTNDRGVATVV
ncbi:Aste57867_8166 [Aphanomyces stellatus]|uniref:Aste57867_8166 protein n=1 Tax=Aphanomyces stellatus TaxID=120398 RepID=A0A485KJK6_9STRA|nr:hypothetical protein As57867_008136 [Aphanomyces stellatus]VFT85054.1 Aste57867_8166 [Aphanomyces stellatus]